MAVDSSSIKVLGDATPVIEVRGLTKRYGSKVLAVNDLKLDVCPGEIYGLLGPNGAGKTTTLKMLLGLIKPTAGEARLLGHQAGSRKSLAGVGAFVETPAFYPHLSGQDNLKALAYYSDKKVSRDDMAGVLDQVELSAQATKKVRGYSTGMKQRLGLAAALLEEPELLILDEPTNGLDPKGVAEIRNFIASLKGKRTVLLSSHILSEIEQLSDRIGIIRQGSLVAEGTVDQFTADTSLLVRAEPLAEAARVASTLEEVEKVQVTDGMLRLSVDPEYYPTVNRKLVYAGIELHEARPTRRTLEEVFLEVTKKDDRDAG